jgi:hypothetical protein
MQTDEHRWEIDILSVLIGQHLWRLLFLVGYNMAMHETISAARRTLHFIRLEEVVTDVQKLADAENAGKLRCWGNWTFGQILNHLATWVDYSFEGVPLKLPFFVKWIMRPMKKRMLTQPMKPGAKIPKVPGGTLAMSIVPSAEALAHFYKSFDRLKKNAPAISHALFGPMTHEESIAQHLRHSELHLSFLSIDP